MRSSSSQGAPAYQATPDASSLNKHQRKTQAMKLRLLKAARRVFARDGFEAASIDDIAAAAGHTRGAFYAHFNTKEELFLALVEQQILDHVKALRTRLETCRTDSERLRCLREHYVASLADRHWSILMIEFKLFTLRHGNLRARTARAYRQMKAILRLQLEPVLPISLLGPPEVHEMKRLALEALLTGLVLESAYDPKRVSESDLGSILRQAFDLFLNLSV
jgi:AcrR family transcriptional regulator